MSEIRFVCSITTEKYVKIIALIQRFIFVRTNSCIHSDELASRNAAVGPYKTKPLNKGDNTVIIYLLLRLIVFAIYLHDGKV